MALFLQTFCVLGSLLQQTFSRGGPERAAERVAGEEAEAAAAVGAGKEEGKGKEAGRWGVEEAGASSLAPRRSGVALLTVNVCFALLGLGIARRKCG